MKTSHSFGIAADRFTGCLASLGATEIETHVDHDGTGLVFQGLFDGEPFFLRPSRTDLLTAETGCERDWDAVRRKVQTTWPA